MRGMVNNRKLDGNIVADLFNDKTRLETVTNQIGEMSWPQRTLRKS
jgi:hypothetical protein